MTLRQCHATLLISLMVVVSVQAQETSPPFKRLDRNQDGKLTKDELPGPLFDRIDTNNDGVITAAEDQAFSRHRANQLREEAMQVPETVHAELNLPYAATDNPRQTLDLYLPKSPIDDTPLPIIIFIHGGGWRQGDKRRGYQLLFPLLETGAYAVASVGYRLSREAVWPAQIHDCKAAVRWLRANAKKYHLAPDKIGAVGPSAGGHLVAMLGTAGEVAELEGSVGRHRNQSSKVRCVVDLFGPTELLSMGGWHNNADSPESRLIGGPIQQNQETARKASPTSHVSKEDPPFLIIHGTKDPLVPFDQSQRLHRTLKEAGVESTLVPVQGGGHGGFPRAEVAARLQAFFDKHLRGKDVSVSREAIEFGSKQP